MIFPQRIAQIILFLYSLAKTSVLIVLLIWTTILDHVLNKLKTVPNYLSQYIVENIENESITYIIEFFDKYSYTRKLIPYILHSLEKSIKI